MSSYCSSVYNADLAELIREAAALELQLAEKRPGRRASLEMRQLAHQQLQIQSMRSRITDLDDHGFPLPPGITSEAYRAHKCRLAAKTIPRLATRWQSLIQPNGALCDTSWRLKGTIRLGIPADLRPAAWMKYSGADALRASYAPGYYLEVCGRCIASRMFELEVGQTFVSNQMFASLQVSSAVEGKKVPSRVALARVLLAYAQHFGLDALPGSLPILASALLIVLMNEEQVFWLLLVHTSRTEPSFNSLYGKACLAEQTVLWKLLEEKQDRLMRHLKAYDINSLHGLTNCWACCLFTEHLPFDTLLRVLDAYFHEGPKILLRVGLALFALKRSSLLQLSDQRELQQAIKELPRDVLDQEELMKEAFNGIGSMSTTHIDKLRRKALEVQTVLSPPDDGSLVLSSFLDEYEPDELPYTSTAPFASAPIILHMKPLQLQNVPLSISPPRYRRPPCQVSPIALSSLAEEEYDDEFNA